MFMLFLLGLLDLLIGLVFVFLRFGLDIKFFALALAVYVVIKSLIFIKDFSSIVDLIGGIALFVFAFFGFTNLLMWLFAVWFIQKGFFSLIR